MPAVDPRGAMVLTSGGAKGAYAVGVMKALFTGASPATSYVRIDPGIYCGSSVGAYASAVLGSHPGMSAVAGIDLLERIWLTQIAQTLTSCGNGVFRIRGLPQSINPACYLNPVADMLELASDGAFMVKEGFYHLMQFVNSDLPPAARFIESLDISAFFDSSPLLKLIEGTVDL